MTIHYHMTPDHDTTTDYKGSTYSSLAYMVPGTDPQLVICAYEGVLRVVPLDVELTPYPDPQTGDPEENNGIADYGLQLLNQVWGDWRPAWIVPVGDDATHQATSATYTAVEE